jgi:hypothetical protein
MMKAAVATLKKFPEFNASLDGDALVLKKYWHIGFAADTPHGLVVPVIRDVDKQGRGRDRQGDGRARQAGPRRQAQARPDVRAAPSRSARASAASAASTSRRSSTRPRSRSWACARAYWKQHSPDGKTSAWRLIAAAVAVVGPPRHRRCRRGALQRALRQPARRHAAGHVLKGRQSWHKYMKSIKVPDIGDFKDVAVIEVMVKPARRSPSTPVW